MKHIRKTLICIVLLLILIIVFLNGIITLEHPSEFIKLKYGKRKHTNYYNKYNISYNQIDKEYFAIKLTEIGFADSIMEQKIREYNVDKL